MPGLNAPIPPGTQFGYQAGGWGKPPVNEDGEPLYGDVFGQFADEEDDEQVTPPAVHTCVSVSDITDEADSLAKMLRLLAAASKHLT